MPLRTTTIGAYPKPDYVQLKDWFSDRVVRLRSPTEHYDSDLEALGTQAEAIFVRGTADAIRDQIDAGVDIPTDGEIRRENYIHYHCRHLDGIDFNRLTSVTIRNGAIFSDLPTITGPIGAQAPFLPHDWQVAQSFTDRPVKITLPGPMTIIDTLADDYYGDPVALGAALADALNAEILALAEAGCRHIQVDEPVFARKPEQALAFGIEHVDRCFHGTPQSVVRTVHMCCGYPNRIDNPDYPKAPLDSYQRLADAIEDSSIQAVSIEDAHRPNDLSMLEAFKTTTVIFGAIAIAKSQVESTDEIRSRLAEALQHIDADRLIAAPDCGLAMLGRPLALEKLRNLTTAAKLLG